ncbi:hypothetical protein DRE_03377 [Drechslerella stenobrocha 248]|uniref:F-box domain-containing protein n=1 Tax=Drechslerella stenobrocha 248 TaxID=1043628 RepID=W7I508_9PEZI|nr:hypothetical protein DRE_03377 [Drechslerella stenobrocha 248]
MIELKRPEMVPLLLIYGHSTCPLPLELQYQILESAEWFQHTVLAEVCKAWRIHLSKPKNRSKLYEPLTRSTSSIHGRTTNRWEPPRIHKAIACQNLLRWDNSTREFKWARIGDAKEIKYAAGGRLSRGSGSDRVALTSFYNQPAFRCFESGKPVTVGLFISKYRSARGSFCTPQRLMLNEVMSVGKLLGLMHKWRSDDRKCRARNDGNPISWILCNYFVENHGENLVGDRYVSVVTEMEQDAPEEFAFRTRMFAERLELDFDKGFLNSRIAQ